MRVLSVMRELQRSVVVKEDLSRMAKLLIHWSVNIPVLRFGS